jgi:hypothetical protein
MANRIPFDIWNIDDAFRYLTRVVGLQDDLAIYELNEKLEQGRLPLHWRRTDPADLKKEEKEGVVPSVSWQSKRLRVSRDFNRNEVDWAIGKVTDKTTAAPLSRFASHKNQAVRMSSGPCPATCGCFGLRSSRRQMSNPRTRLWKKRRAEQRRPRPSNQTQDGLNGLQNTSRLMIGNTVGKHVIPENSKRYSLKQRKRIPSSQRQTRPASTRG